jgi:hypothetical protein
MPEKTIKRRLAEAGARELADDDGPIFSTVAKLVDALQRAVRDLPADSGGWLRHCHRQRCLALGWPGAGADP